MLYDATLEYAKKLDKKDPLRKFRNKFHFPVHKKEPCIYFCGQSLGLLSKNVKENIHQELNDWKNLAINGYREAKNPWLYYQHYFKGPLSKLMGCTGDEVTVMNTLTVNLHLLMVTFYRPNRQRFKIIMEGGAFPSDQYAVETQVKLHGYLPKESIVEVFPREGEKLLRTEDILEVIRTHKDNLALVLFGGINYYTGQLFDMKAITAAAHESGAYAGFDLAHAAGNVPLELHHWKVDFAMWCSYKYLNGGPGAAGGIYIHEKFANDPALIRLGGWWGNDEQTRFDMEKGFIPQKGAGGWNLSTAQVFNMVSLKASLQLIDQAGIENLRNKSLLLTGFLEFLLKKLKHIDFDIISPADEAQRGAQLSVFFHSSGEEIHRKMMEAGIIVDYRHPGVIRIAPVPIYNSFEDVFRLYTILKEY